MFEQQIEKTITLLADRTIGSSNSIKLRRILDSNIPESFKTFFQSDVDEWLRTEHERIFHSTHFDYTDETLHTLIRELNAQSKMHAIYQRDEFQKTLERGVKLLFNYTCRPQWTLVKFIFDEIQSKKIDEILKEMNFFSDYNYYKTILEKYFSKRNITEFPVSKFDELLHLIDQEVIKNYNSHQMAEITSPIYHLFNIDSDMESAWVPVEALTIFYDDKGNNAIVERLQHERDVKGRSTITLHELTVLISEVEFAVGVEISELVNLHLAGRAPAQQKFDFSDLQRKSGEEIEQLVHDELMPEQYTPSLTEVLKEEGIAELPEEVKSDSIFDVPEFKDSDLEILPDEDISTLGHLPPSQKEDKKSELLDEFKFDKLDEKTEAFEPEEFKLDDALLNLKDTGDDSIPDLSIEFEKAYSEEKDNVTKDIDREFDTTDKKRDEKIPDFTFEAPKDEVPKIEFEEESEPILQQRTAAPPTIPMEPAAVIAKFGDLQQLISSSDKKKYMKKIFSRNEERYAQAIDILNSKSTWKEASEYIDEIFLTNDVDMYSRVAVHFTDEIYKRYLPKK